MSMDTRGTRSIAWGSERMNRPRSASAGRPRTCATSQWVGPVAGALALLGFFMMVGTLPTARELASVPTAAAASVRVAPNDTLWSIAQANPVPGLTTAETVERIVSMNGLDDATLHAGAVLEIPAEPSTGSAMAQSQTADRAN